MRGAEDFFVEANGLSGDQTSFRHQRGLRPPESTRFSVRAFFLVEDLISQLNIHHFQEEYLRSARNPQDFPKVVFLLRRKGRNKSQTAFLRSYFEVGPEQMLGNMVAELRFGWLEFAMFQTTLAFWNLYEVLKFYMADAWKTSTHVTS